MIIDSDIAKMFGVPTKRLNEKVKRNIKRFPEHFMFQLTEEEKSEVVANCDHLENLKYSSYLPFVFTEHGIVMLANVLNSDRAIETGIRIVEIFIKMREILLNHKDLLEVLEEMKVQMSNHNEQIMLLFEYLQRLEDSKPFEQDSKNRKKIGFRIGKDEG